MRLFVAVRQSQEPTCLGMQLPFVPHQCPGPIPGGTCQHLFMFGTIGTSQENWMHYTPEVSYPDSQTIMLDSIGPTP